MAKKDKDNKKDKKKADINPELEDFSLEVNEFGQIESNYDVEKINEFLNEHVDDKKLVGRDDLKKKPGTQKEKEEKKKKKKDE